MKSFVGSLCLLLLHLFGCAGSAPRAAAELRASDGRVVGRAEFQQRRAGVVVRLDVQGLPPGAHGAHIHQRAACTPPDFRSAGDHFDHSGADHDHAAAGGHHAGDLPNLEVGRDGRGAMESLILGIRLTGEDAHSLMRGGGTSIVLHQNEDDFSTEPSGNAGARIACGVIVPVR